jgi:hypothetical protein
MVKPTRLWAHRWLILIYGRIRRRGIGYTISDMFYFHVASLHPSNLHRRSLPES